ncbi:MAG: glycosyl hydrolase, partial [Planctomycetota bacterium]
MASHRTKTKAKREELRTLLIGTAKGGFALEAPRARRAWTLRGPFQFGARTHDFRADPRESGFGTWLMCSAGGHLGPTIYRSRDAGRSWKEA